MLREATGVGRIIIRTGKTDLRLGIDRLASLVQVEYGLDPLEEGTLFLFCGTRPDRIKGLLYEEGDFLLLTKRLSKGAFMWPRNVSEARELSHNSFDALMRGYEVTSSLRIFQKKGADQQAKDSGGNGQPDEGLKTASAMGIKSSTGIMPGKADYVTEKAVHGASTESTGVDDVENLCKEDAGERSQGKAHEKAVSCATSNPGRYE